MMISWKVLKWFILELSFGFCKTEENETEKES